MLVIKDTSLTSDIALSAIINCTTKVDMLKICKKLDLYVSPNIKKDETARRLADEIYDNITNLLCNLNKTELELVDEFVNGGPNHYVVRRIRKTSYKLQRYNLVLTYEDKENQKWYMIMPNKLREALSETYKPFLELVKQGKPLPTPKDLRFMSLLNQLSSREE